VSSASTVPSVELPYWAGLGAGRFTQPRCAACLVWHWPARARCAECGSFEREWVEVAARGTVYAWTRTWYPFVPDRSEDLPYVVVVAELAEAGGARVLGVLEGDEAALAVGVPVTGRVAPASAQADGLATVVWSVAS
jgi:uncharacterized protein